MRQLRLLPALGICLLALGASPSAPATEAVARAVTGYVDVDFAGSAAFVRPRTTMESYGWSEHALLPVVAGEISTRGAVDQLSGSGAIADGECAARYTSTSSPRGTPYGVRTHVGGGGSLVVTGVAPFPLFRADPHACPAGVLARLLRAAPGSSFPHLFKCILKPLAWCRQTYRLPLVPVTGGGTVTASARLYAQYLRPDDLTASRSISSYLNVLIPQLRIWSVAPIPALHVMSVATTIPSPATGSVVATASLPAVRLASVVAKVRKGARTRMTVVWDRAGLATAARLQAPAQLTVAATLTPTNSAPVSLARSAYIP